MALDVLFVPHLVPPCFKLGKPLFVAAHLSAINPQGRPRQRIQKRTVVRNKDIGRAGGFQFVFQPRNRLNIQMVGRFVQQHQFGRFGHQFGQGRASPLATRCGGHRAIWIKL